MYNIHHYWARVGTMNPKALYQYISRCFLQKVLK
jgi:hypothetical protein